MNEKVETQRRKKTEHTRIVAQLCSSANAIFTSVVVYSRTSQKQKTTIKTTGLLCGDRFLIVVFRFIVIIFMRVFNNVVDKKRRKKTEHTRMYAQLCSSGTQYSRRLLSILAQDKKKNQKIVTRVFQLRKIGFLASHVILLF